MKGLNIKHCSLKFDFNYSKDKTKFFDTLVYVDQHQKLQTTLKPSNYIYGNSSTLYKKHCLWLGPQNKTYLLNVSRICKTFRRTYREIYCQRIQRKNYQNPN